MHSPKNWSLALLLATLLLLTPALRADDTAYFIGSGGQFGTVDLDTGAAMMLGTSSIPNYQIAGLAQVGGTLYTAGYTASTLYTVNPASGALNPVGSSIEFFALGSTTTGLYAAGWPAGTNTQANPTIYFYSIDPRTAAATQIGQFGPGLGAFYTESLSTGSSTLYFADYQNLYSIDTNSGNATLIGGTSGIVAGGLTYENGKLYAGNCCGTTSVYTLNATSGAATLAANVTGLSNPAAFAGLAPITPPTTPQILSQFAFGGGWYSALYFTNSNAGSVSFTVNFTSDNGSPLTVPSVGGSSTTLNLAPQQTAVLEAPNSGTLNQGYVTASLPGGVSGYGVFRQSVQGIADQEAVVPLASSTSTSSTLIWDDTDYTTAVAIANPSVVPVTVSVAVWNSTGNVIGTSSISLAAGTKTEGTLRSFPGLGAVAGNRGSARFTVSSGSIAVLGLRFNGAAFTSIPTTQQ
jgi:hypothetical protein